MMRPPSQIPNPETERELRQAVLILTEEPTDAASVEVLLDFVSRQLRIGRTRTPTARRIAKDSAHVGS